MAYSPQYGPGTSNVAENRRNQMNPDYKLTTFRHITDEDIVLLLGHRVPGEAYKNVHPPLAEQQEPECPMRKLVKPTEGTVHGDRVRYVQFADSMYNAPSQPYQRTYAEMYRFRAIDPGTLSGRQIVECRERDLDQYTRLLIETEMFDPALVSLRGATVHGHSLRLSEDGMQFDALQRCTLGKDGMVRYVKNQIGIPLDHPVEVGRPMSEEWLRNHSTIFHSLVGTALRDDPEYVEYLQRIHTLRTRYGFLPEEE